MTPGELLRQARRRHGLTQQQLAARARTSQAAVSRIGGLAGIARGSSYPSYDVDIAYERGRENLERLAEALRELGATLRGASADLPFQVDAKTLENGQHFTFETPFGSLDILSDPVG